MSPKPRIRQRFGPSQDYLLVVQVNTDLPFCAPYGGLMAGWEKVATTLNGSSAFKMHHLKGPIAKNRFERLVARHRDWVKNGSHPDDVPSHDEAYQKVMAEVVPKLDAAEADPQSQKLGKRGRPRKIKSEDGEAPTEKKPALGATQVTIAPSPLGPQPPTASTSLLVDSEDQALPIANKATRQRFTHADDLLLVKYVKQVLPFRAKFGAISAAWEDVAYKLDNSPDFSKDNVKGPIVRYRFENLMAKYRERVKLNNGSVVGPKGAPAGELEVLMTELVTLYDGGDPVSAALLAQNVAIATGAVNAVAARNASRASSNQDEDEDSISSTPSEPLSPVGHSSGVNSSSTQSFIAPSTRPVVTSASTSSALTVSSTPTNITELKALLEELVEQQSRATEQMILLQREERRLEVERREREREREREEREKDRQALTSAVISVMKTFLEQNSHKD